MWFKDDFPHRESPELQGLVEVKKTWWILRAYVDPPLSSSWA